ncbi:MAG: thioredoxin domain-containing protein [Anaerolineales bacterium]|jgi:uncharacterized protein YyaL (SSP411 family)
MSNKLRQETSPYLLQHADNPVDWFPWGEEAFERAKNADKPIFLSIGYAACHWCHVMAHESFEDPETAAIMNDHFVNIKVDREERPDVDSIYMDAVVALNGQGGWPLSAFLTPEGKPFFGGTYFPAQRRFNMPSFQEVLDSIHQEWTNNRERVEKISEQLSQHVQAKPAIKPKGEEFEIAALDAAAEQLFENYDWQNGGWGIAPKFPSATTIEFLLQRYHRKKDRLALDMAKHVLRSMAQGGLFDQIGGGFHRYSVDEKWLVPHFEKMLYDNAVLLPAYLHAWQLTGEKDFLEVVEKTTKFLFREMQDPEGGFYASLDADSEGEEGTFYIWSESEIRSILPDEKELEIVMEVYGLREGPNFEGANILFKPASFEESAEKLGISPEQLRSNLDNIDTKLLAHRAKRSRPATDEKIITAWNGLLLSALAEIARVLKSEEHLAAAQTLAHFMASRLKTKSGWKRTWRNNVAKHRATLRDLSATALGYLALYETDFNPLWFHETEAITAEILKHYQDPDGGFFDSHEDQHDLIARPKSIQDTPLPSGNSLTVQLLLRLYSFTGNDQYAAPAERAVRGMQSIASQHPTAFAGWLSSLQYAISPRLQVALIGNPEDAQFTPFEQALDDRYLPFLIRAAGTPDSEPSPPILLDRPQIDEKVTAYLCQGFICHKPTNSVESFLEQLDEALSR